MTAYKYLDGNNKTDFVFPYQDIMISMTEALRDQNRPAYIDLVGHFRNMSILAFDEKDIKNLEKIDKIKAEFKKHIDIATKNKMESSTLYSIENVYVTNEKNLELKNTCEYKLSGVIERICISALRKTIFKDQVPEAQSSIFYDSSRDLELAIQNFNYILEENEISAYEVKK